MKSLVPRPSWTLGIAVSLVALMSACATAPTELAQAREAYNEVENSPAAEYAPADVQTASEALAAAERAFKAEGDDEVTRALAYRALRKAQIAMVKSEIFLATQATEEGRKQLLAEGTEARKSLGKALDRSESELAAANQLAAMTESELEAERERLAELESEFQTQVQEGELTEQELAARKQELAVAQTELENERKQREDAERRLKETRAELEKIAKIKEDANQLVITLTGEVLFELGKAELRQTAQRRLDQVAEMLLAQRNASIRVEGHTDSQGAEDANRDLSLRRAQAVTGYLQSKGIAGDRLEAVGKGETSPVGSNDNASGRANNRRVEIIVDKQNGASASR